MSSLWDPAAHRPRFVIGLDVGQQVDYSALAAVSQVDIRGDTVDPRTGQLRFVPEFHVKWLERWPLMTPFREVVHRTAQLRNDPALCESVPHGDDSIEYRRATVCIDAGALVLR